MGQFSLLSQLSEIMGQILVKFNESHFQQTKLVGKLFFSHGIAQLISGTDPINQVFVTETVTPFVLIRTEDVLLCTE